MDFLIRNGLLYDPAAHRLIRKDVALVEGKIVYPAVNAALPVTGRSLMHLDAW